jgi:hypothetical protein
MSPKSKFPSDEAIERKYDIKFRIGVEHWPEELKSLLLTASKISSIQYDEWKSKESSSESTWRQVRRKDADKFVKDAKLLRQYTPEKYESSWRDLETHMFKTLRNNSFW